MGGIDLPLSPPLTPPLSTYKPSSSSPDYEYKLPRGGRESVRLTAQHHMLKGRQGWLLHPEVSSALRTIQNPQIADVATGTGIWALEVAQQLPHADVVGLDVSDKQFYPKWTLPSNMTLGLCDILEEVPAKYRGKFDVVHIRLLLCAGPAADKQIFINYFRTLLKPGGWLQWDDLSFPNLYACYPSCTQQGVMQRVILDDHPMPQMNRKYFAMQEKAGWFTQFEEVMMDAGGFEKLQRVDIPPCLQLLQIESDLSVAVVTEMFEMLLCKLKIEQPALSEASIEVRNAIARVHADAESGILLSYAWNVGIAKKL
jgi:ubiquinone/menaquinone biosynthesis C-methylase UbiE